MNQIFPENVMGLKPNKCRSDQRSMDWMFSMASMQGPVPMSLCNKNRVLPTPHLRRVRVSAPLDLLMDCITSTRFQREFHEKADGANFSRVYSRHAPIGVLRVKDAPCHQDSFKRLCYMRMDLLTLKWSCGIISEIKVSRIRERQ